ncbi:MAG: response regulator [Burkholderiales bacterium]|nr:response regulator [Anaerolineae bacterium]
MEKTRVFLVEDDESLHKVFKQFLKREGFDLIGTSAEADESLRVMQRILDNIDVVIVDSQMPNSRKVITTIVDNVPRIAVVVLTSSIPKPANQIPNVTYFEQPITPERLTEVIQESIAQRLAVNAGRKFKPLQASNEN